MKKCLSKNQIIYKVDIDEFITYILENKPSISEVEKHFNICRCSIYSLIKRIGNPDLVLRKDKRTSNASKHVDEIVRMYNEGYNVRDLTKYFHSPKRYVSKVLKDAGIKIQRDKKSIEYKLSKSVQTLTDNAEG